MDDSLNTFVAGRLRHLKEFTDRAARGNYVELNEVVEDLNRRLEDASDPDSHWAANPWLQAQYRLTLALALYRLKSEDKALEQIQHAVDLAEKATAAGVDCVELRQRLAHAQTLAGNVVAEQAAAHVHEIPPIDIDVNAANAMSAEPAEEVTVKIAVMEVGKNGLGAVAAEAQPTTTAGTSTPPTSKPAGGPVTAQMPDLATREEVGDEDTSMSDLAATQETVESVSSFDSDLLAAPVEETKSGASTPKRPHAEAITPGTTPRKASPGTMSGRSSYQRRKMTPEAKEESEEEETKTPVAPEDLREIEFLVRKLSVPPNLRDIRVCGEIDELGKWEATTALRLEERSSHFVGRVQVHKRSAVFSYKLVGFDEDNVLHFERQQQGDRTMDASERLLNRVGGILVTGGKSEPVVWQPVAHRSVMEWEP